MPKLIKFAIFLILAAGIMGCSEIQNYVSTASLNNQEKTNYDNMLVLDQKLLPLGSYRSLGQVRGKSCKPSLTSISPVSKKEARKNLRIKASKMGGNAITNLACKQHDTGDQSKECFRSIVCEADVVKINSQEVLSELRQKLSRDGKEPEKQEKACGVGWLTPPGAVVTSHRVVRESKEIFLDVSRGERIAGKLAGKDSVNDIAIIAPQNSLKPHLALPLADSTPSRGSRVYILDSRTSSGVQEGPKSIKGEVNATSGLNEDPRLFRITSSLENNCTGNPVLDSRGEVVGIIIPRRGTQGLSDNKLPRDQHLALKIAYVKPMLDSYNKETPGQKHKTLSLSKEQLESNRLGRDAQNRTGVFNVTTQ